MDKGEWAKGKPAWWFLYFYISRSFQDTPLLQFAFDGLEITLENHIVHDPAIEETLRYDP